MVDDIRSQPENGKNKEESTSGEPPEEQSSTQVDSLVKNDFGSITAGNREPGRLKKHAHKFLSVGMSIWPSTKKQKMAGAFIITGLLLIGGSGVYALTKHLAKSAPPENPVVTQKKEEPPKTSEPSRLTGVEVPLDINKRPVTAIMIENSPDARPQSGLKDAGIVFEAIAEGGITRFNALFLESQPDYIGPVRSVRPYYIDLFLPFDASIVHAGGSAEGLAKLKALGVKDIDHGANGGAFRRVSNRFAPHNLYTSMAALDTVNQQRGYTSSNFTSWERKKEAPGQTPAARVLDFALSGPLYDPHFVYDPASNSYLRSEGGKPHTDERTGAQLAPKVVIALAMAYSKNGIYSVYQTSGAGTMFVFQDGQVQQGTWKKGESKTQFEFLDANGKKLALNPGQTWVTLVSNPGAVRYAP